MASKRRKLDHGNQHSEIQREKKVENTEILPKETLIYIVPKKIAKARLQVLNNLARKKGFPLTEHHRSAQYSQVCFLLLQAIMTITMH